MAKQKERTIEEYILLQKLTYQYLKKEKLLSKSGAIDFWNEKDYFLTENFMIVWMDKFLFFLIKIFSINYTKSVLW